jgi:cytochrome c biogenesis protein CcmG/thiol:disulfide interchange protein DsbE
MRKKNIFLITLILLTFIFGCGSTEAEKAVYEKARDFEIQDIYGNKVHLSDYSGKIIILNFFATWCPPCRRELPDFNAIAIEYEKDVKVIAVNVGRESAPYVRDFAKNNNLNFTIVIDEGQISALYGPITAIPVTVIIDRDFDITKRYVGLRTREVFLEDIQKML